MPSSQASMKSFLQKAVFRPSAQATTNAAEEELQDDHETETTLPFDFVPETDAVVTDDQGLGAGYPPSALIQNRPDGIVNPTLMSLDKNHHKRRALELGGINYAALGQDFHLYPSQTSLDGWSEVQSAANIAKPAAQDASITTMPETWTAATSSESQSYNLI
ncbi:hypothetical protein H2200_003667 [Cladophialophora chaetospira]|uniref:Uncharacterized protein n=1 Tax=Cladophialophora chaetospira TaxID=386627 RepID=A0AA38XEU6_9EURO|nr:hypothetical protein H2200_003667 [Cladophialophora chaetospira]